jgi:hypothetical protein
VTTNRRIQEEPDMTVATFGWLEWSFVAFVGTMTALAGLFSVYVLVQVFRNPSRR